MIEKDLGFMWPVGDSAYRLTRLKNAKAVAAFVWEHVPNRRQCVQAGGHVGLWPKALAPLFEQVYTFEPNADNFAALGHNVGESNVFAARGVLGEYHKLVSIKRDKPESGVFYVIPNVGMNIPTFLIDDLVLPHCDAIILDVEGSELPALRGATETIKRCSPLIILECMNWGDKRGHGSTADAHMWLESMGYDSGVPVVGHDRCFRKKDQ